MRDLLHVTLTFFPQTFHLTGMDSNYREEFSIETRIDEVIFVVAFSNDINAYIDWQMKREAKNMSKCIN